MWIGYEYEERMKEMESFPLKDIVQRLDKALIDLYETFGGSPVRGFLTYMDDNFKYSYRYDYIENFVCKYDTLYYIGIEYLKSWASCECCSYYKGLSYVRRRSNPRLESLHSYCTRRKRKTIYNDICLAWMPRDYLLAHIKNKSYALLDKAFKKERKEKGIIYTHEELKNFFEYYHNKYGNEEKEHPAISDSYRRDFDVCEKSYNF